MSRANELGERIGYAIGRVMFNPFFVMGAALGLIYLFAGGAPDATVQERIYGCHVIGGTARLNRKGAYEGCDVPLQLRGTIMPPEFADIAK